MNIRVTDDAADDLENIKARIARDDGAAERVVEQIRSTIRVLGELPHLGHDGTVAGTYERTVSLIQTPGDHFLAPGLASGRGHQWKSVLWRIICCWWVRATQRSATALSSSSMVSK